MLRVAPATTSHPTSVLETVHRTPLACPRFLPRVAAGFPSPASGYIDGPLDLNDLLIQHPESTFFVRVEGDSMIGAGIHSGDVLVVDRAVQASVGDVVIAALEEALIVKRLDRRGDALYLVAENDAYPPVRVTTELVIWGVAQHVIHKLR